MYESVSIWSLLQRSFDDDGRFYWVDETCA
jgi:hypothetical protein